MRERKERLAATLCALAGIALLATSFLSCAAPVEQTIATTTVSTDSAQTSVGRSRRKGAPTRPIVRLASKPGRGGLKLVYGELTAEHRKEIAQVFKEERLFEDVLDSLNAGLVLPQTVEVRLQECEEANAFYDPEQKAILLCYEVFEHFVDIFGKGQADPQSEEVATKAVAALVFTFYHELGHALIDVYDLPITGREEDAVDQLATVMLLETWEGEESELAILSSAEWFNLDAVEAAEREDAPDMADEHSLDEQRYYNLVCWTYGSDPEYFSEMATEWELPEERAQQCPSEYARMSASWNRLLGPHMRPEPETSEGAP